jgi:hypothetical protein
MVFFHPPHNSLRRLGETVYSMDQATPSPASPVSVVPAPAAVVPAPVLVPAPTVIAPDAVSNYDQGVMSLSAAGLVVGGIVVIGLALTVSNALARR